MTSIGTTTTQLIDDPDRVSPKVSCVTYAAASDAIKVINTTATPTMTCDYYV